MNAIVVFVMALLAVIAGGFINAKLHPFPDFKMGKDGLITAVVPVGGGHPTRAARAAARAARLLRHRPADGGQFRGRLGGAVPADHHGGDGARPEGDRQRAEEHAVDPQQPAAAHEQPKLSIAHVARGQGQAARGGARRNSRRAEESRAAGTSTTCCSPASWCSDGHGRCRRRAPRTTISEEEVSALLEKQAAGGRCGRSISRRNASTAPSCRCCRPSPRASRRAPRARCRGSSGATPRVEFTSIESMRAADLQASLPTPGERRGGAPEAARRPRLHQRRADACCSRCWMHSSADRAGRPGTRRRLSRPRRNAFSRSC